MSGKQQPTSVSTDPIRVPSIPDIVYETLRSDIARGVYEPGPISIRQLAERFGVSTMPVREALRLLQAEGLVSFAGARQVSIIALSLEDLEEIFLIRGELESLALQLAMPTLVGDKGLLRRLDSLLDEMDQQDDYDHWRQANNTFHTTLYEAANKPRLLSIITSQAVAVEPYARRYGIVENGLTFAQAQHRKIVTAVREDDGPGAVSELRQHLEAAFDVFRRASVEK